MGVFAGLTQGADLAPAALDTLRDRVDARDAAGVRDWLAGSRAIGPAADALQRLSSLAGDASVLDEAEQTLAFCPPAAAAVRELRGTVAALTRAGLGAHVAVDLGAVKGLGYHTGLLFRAYAPDLGFEVGGGGRYDTLLGRFGRPMPAVGFMLGLDRLALLLDRQGAAPNSAAPQARTVQDADLGAALGQARSLRESGARVRLEAAGATAVTGKQP
jgi:ATP phosphoribosyltransferase regulatory subunit